jgi:hypothetical protein
MNQRADLIAEARVCVERLDAIAGELRDLGFGALDEVNDRLGHDPDRSWMRTVDIQALVSIARSEDRIPT